MNAPDSCVGAANVVVQLVWLLFFLHQTLCSSLHRKQSYGILYEQAIIMEARNAFLLLREIQPEADTSIRYTTRRGPFGWIALFQEITCLFVASAVASAEKGIA